MHPYSLCKESVLRFIILLYSPYILRFYINLRATSGAIIYISHSFRFLFLRLL